MQVVYQEKTIVIQENLLTSDVCHGSQRLELHDSRLLFILDYFSYRIVKCMTVHRVAVVKICISIFLLCSNICFYIFKICVKDFAHCNIPDWTVSTATRHIGLLFILPPKRSHFRSAECIGLLGRCVNSIPNLV